MKIALIGYGKMGKTIEKLAKERGHEISMIIDQDNAIDLTAINPSNTDVAIEFSQPESAFQNISTLLKSGVKTVSGTTGWLDKFSDVVSICEENKGTFLYASNFSIGVNLFFEMNEWLASKMNGLEGFHPSMEEIHHLEKKDAPSGTAITLAEGILKNIHTLDEWVEDISVEKNKIGIVSKREEGVPGTHTVFYRSPLETIQITHTAHDRKVFAEGVIKVAEWTRDQNGVLSIRDFIKNIA